MSQETLYQSLMQSRVSPYRKRTIDALATVTSIETMLRDKYDQMSQWYAFQSARREYLQ